MPALVIRDLPACVLAGLVLVADPTSAAAQSVVADQAARYPPNGGAVISVLAPVGQEFVPTRPSLDSIELCTGDAAVGNGLGIDLWLNVRTGNITGPIVATSERLVLPDGFAGPGPLIGAVTRFDFAQAVALTPGARYVLEVVAGAGDEWGLSRIFTTSWFDPYPGGSAIINGLPAASDLWFAEGHACPPLTAVTPCGGAPIPPAPLMLVSTIMPLTATPGESVRINAWPLNVSGVAAVTTVTVDLTSIGGTASAALYNDGTNGDGWPDDHWFSRSVVVDRAAPPGEKRIPLRATLTDGRQAAATVLLVVTAAPAAPLLADQSNLREPRYGTWHGARSGEGSIKYYGPLGQGFRPSLPWLDAVVYRTTDGETGCFPVPCGVPGGTLLVKVRRDTITGPIVGVSHPIVLPADFGTPPDRQLVGGLTRFDFPHPVPLEPGAAYVAEIVIVSGGNWMFTAHPRSAGVEGPFWVRSRFDSASRPNDTSGARFLAGPIAREPRASMPPPPPPERDGLVIQEFRTHGFETYGGDADIDSFVEIRNAAPGRIGLQGWEVVVSDDHGATSVLARLDDVVIEPGCSWLIGSRDLDGYFGPVDQAYVGRMAAAGGLALRTPDGRIADQVGLGAGSAFGEGTRLEPLPPIADADRSYERSGDTGDNAADFHVIEPSTPRTWTDGCGSGPSTPPTAVGASQPASPRGGDRVLLTATVTPGANPTGAWVGVEALTTALDGSLDARPFYDDGTHGDVTAGDRVFSLEVTVGAGIQPGGKVIPLLISDSQRRASYAPLPVTVALPPVVSMWAAGSVTSPSTLTPGAPARIEVRAHPSAADAAAGLAVTMDLSALGGARATWLSDAGGGICDATADDGLFSACVVLPAATAAGGLVLPGVVVDGDGGTAAFEVTTTVSPPADADGDGLSDAYEAAFGLNAQSASGDDGPLGDPDRDGRSNIEEFRAGSHPRGQCVRYLAEGLANAFGRTRIAMLNPSDQPAAALVRIQPEGSPERQVAATVPPRSRRTLTLEDVATLVSGAFATVVESDVEIAVERFMSWGARDYGSSAEVGIQAPSTRWIVAEGATGWRFSLFYLLQNPTDDLAMVEVSYLRGRGDPVLTRTYPVGPRQRRTIWVDEEEFPAGSGERPLAATDVSARIVVTNHVPIVVERAMYASPNDQPFGAGHAGSGVAVPSTTWIFAEGATGEFFDEFLLLANASEAQAAATITFTPTGRPPVVRTYTIAPMSRVTVWVDLIPELAATTLAARVDADVPIVAERAMWWPGSGESWREAHVSLGATAGGRRWAIADLEVGGPNAADSYVLITGGGTTTVYFDDGSAPVVCQSSSSGGRDTIYVNECPGVAGKRFVGVLVEGTADTVVEHATYYSRGELFSAGAAALGTRLP